MKITKEWLKEKRACTDSFKYVCQHDYFGLEGVDFINKLIKEDRLGDSAWLIVRIMEYKQYVGYAVFAAEQVIDIFEKEYPKNDMPRKAIEAAKKCINDPSDANKKAAANAAAAAYAAKTAYAACVYAAADAADADAVARKEMQLKILNYGLGLLEVSE